MRLIVPGQPRSEQNRRSTDTMSWDTLPSGLTVQFLDARALVIRGSRDTIILWLIWGTSMGYLQLVDHARGNLIDMGTYQIESISVSSITIWFLIVFLFLWFWCSSMVSNSFFEFISIFAKCHYFLPYPHSPLWTEIPSEPPRSKGSKTGSGFQLMYAHGICSRM